MSVLHYARTLAQRFGVDVTRYPTSDPAFRCAQLLRWHNVTHVVDVGASNGRYGRALRRFGYDGWLISLEPLPDAYAALQHAAQRDGRWVAFKAAAGEVEQEVILNIAGNEGASSSVLPMLARHEQAEPTARYIGTERVRQMSLDSMWRDFAGGDSRVFIKLDVQGYERQVLEGARELMKACVGLQLEVTFVPLYESGLLYQDALGLISELGFTPMLIVPGFSEPRSGQMLQADFVCFDVRASSDGSE